MQSPSTDGSARPNGSPDQTPGVSPLSGIRVLDLTRVYAGPYATFMLAQAGAEIIKVEPLLGENLRRRDGRASAALPFAMLNANKRSLELDIKTPAGREVLLKLAERVDVLVENYRPGVLAALGLTRPLLRARNPRLIVASVSGFGPSGRYRNYPAMDITIQAISGVMATTGFAESGPVKAGPAIADFGSGTHLYGGIVTALLHRAMHGEVTDVQISMLDTQYPTFASSLAFAMGPAEQYVPRTGNRHSGLSLVPYNVYPAADGHIAIVCNVNEHWNRLVKVLERPDLACDERIQTIKGRVQHMEFVDAEIGRSTAAFPREQLFQMLNDAGVPCGPVRELTEVIADPHLRETGMLTEVDHPLYGPMTLPRSPLQFTEAPKQTYRPSVALGADNAAIFAELGLDDAQIEQLRAEGAIA